MDLLWFTRYVFAHFFLTDNARVCYNFADLRKYFLLLKIQESVNKIKLFLKMAAKYEG